MEYGSHVKVRLKARSIFDILRGKSKIYGGIWMAFQLNSVVPWGRNFAEYRLMFELSDEDMKKKIAGFGDGPASFNCEAMRQGYRVTSFDPIYRFSTDELRRRIDEVRDVVMQQK